MRRRSSELGRAGRSFQVRPPSADSKARSPRARTTFPGERVKKGPPLPSPGTMTGSPTATAGPRVSTASGFVQPARMTRAASDAMALEILSIDLILRTSSASAI